MTGHPSLSVSLLALILLRAPAAMGEQARAGETECQQAQHRLEAIEAELEAREAELEARERLLEAREALIEARERAIDARAARLEAEQGLVQRRGEVEAQGSHQASYQPDYLDGGRPLPPYQPSFIDPPKKSP